MQDFCPSNAFLVAFLQLLPEVARRAGTGRHCWVGGTNPLAVSGFFPELQQSVEATLFVLLFFFLTISSILILCRKQHQ